MNVFVRGLQGLQKIVAVKYTGTSDIKLAMTIISDGIKIKEKL